MTTNYKRLSHFFHQHVITQIWNLLDKNVTKDERCGLVHRYVDNRGHVHPETRSFFQRNLCDTCAGYKGVWVNEVHITIDANGEKWLTIVALKSRRYYSIFETEAAADILEAITKAIASHSTRVAA